MAIRKLQNPKEVDSGIYYEFDTEADVLGEGGMGRVYLGKRIGRDGRETKVAIKAMFEGLPDQVIERARREASIRLNNDSLVQMLDFIETCDTNQLGESVIHFHVISEYLEGINLADMMDGKLYDRHGVIHPEIELQYKEYIADREQVSTKIIKSILSGVMALHDLGYIHRDIDPSNIIMTSDGKYKLIDFGVAKQVTRLNTSESLTSSGQFIGKAAYAAPELVLGDVHHQNFSTDVYAIGILYYQLLTGSLPFDGTSYDLMEAQLHRKMSFKQIKSRQIKEVISKATAKKQADRFATSAQFRAAIDSFVFPEPRRITRIVTGFAVLAAVAAIIVVKVLVPGERHVPPPSQEELYGKYLADLDGTDLSLAKTGFEGLLHLAETGYEPAMFQVAYTYVWTKDSVSLARKMKLGLPVYESMDNKLLEGLFKDNSKNEEAIIWLKRLIEKTDSTDYQAMAWLAQYYLNGNVVNKDLPNAISLLEKSKETAIDSLDWDFVSKVNSMLDKIKKQNYD